MACPQYGCFLCWSAQYDKGRMLSEVDGICGENRAEIAGEHSRYGVAFYAVALQCVRKTPGYSIDIRAPRDGGNQKYTGRRAQRELRRQTCAIHQSPTGDISMIDNDAPIVYISDAYSALGGMGDGAPFPVQNPNPPDGGMGETL